MMNFALKGLPRDHMMEVPGPTLGGLLSIAAGDVGCVAVVELLSELGATDALTEADAGHSLFTAALRAAKNGHVDFLRALYTHGAGSVRTHQPGIYATM